MKLLTNKVLTVFFLLVVISPWFWVFIKNRVDYGSKGEKLIFPNNPAIVTRAAVLQKELIDSGFSLGVAKFLVNKVTIFTYEITGRYLESFNPGYLFFQGDLDLKRSTRAAGPLYLAFLPLIIFSFPEVMKRKNRFLLFALLISPLPAIVIAAHYHNFFRIPLFLILTYLAALGLKKITIKKWIFCGILVLLFFELARFIHDFWIHYPSRLP
ncbi:hypothetical protein A2630_01870 [Candidatus Woesebacteria bacterium RIFCSPHIGHO2_01_FULL_44_10]|uniref:Glycosyltransferase RgtA/B/C/D-like domain-containing protein n=1 Tax=Candidatus Woesebacteria bacterium RIFCSPLOWO2_01_FULL_44_14 TaxID=1802525 RepID=A0A1F8C0V9_9BACT|nr:MAG: hypothetical protein A2630_01870 [Candidatus Woesebacteria bacterium RIFCSPHIGHO2_01_FULL_44_10]OGM53998.1 MAG: hypothetical protein A3F62_00315 [Candidatus Woesebacteria bacterium RIFCSPHIGHO2_12_FULL_44_11]OGM69966.1 MAG: hypothetical protein A2975_05155 [Candidatus Woesebacteria bacterium RIFCSPLOWO2_01_FULL_44_14]